MSLLISIEISDTFNLILLKIKYFISHYTAHRRIYLFFPFVSKKYVNKIAEKML